MVGRLIAAVVGRPFGAASGPGPVVVQYRFDRHSLHRTWHLYLQLFHTDYIVEGQLGLLVHQEEQADQSKVLLLDFLPSASRLP